MAYVYIYLNPEKSGRYLALDRSYLYRPMYVGKGSGNRLLHHVSRKLRGNSIFVKWLRKFLKRGLVPSIVKYEDNLSHVEAFELERKLILAIGRIDIGTGILLNQVDGASGHYNLSDEAIVKRAELASKVHKGRKFSDEHRRRLSLSRKGKPGYHTSKHTDKTRLQMSVSAKKRGFTSYMQVAVNKMAQIRNGSKLLIVNGKRTYVAA